MEKMQFNSNNRLESVTLGDNTIPFVTGGEFPGPQWYYRRNDQRFSIEMQKTAPFSFLGEREGIEYGISYTFKQGCFLIKTSLTNNSRRFFSPETCGLTLGIDSYMSSYPQWDNKMFPTLLRCEKDHFWGYFMSPLGNITAITVNNPVASYSHNYNSIHGYGGHRIHSSNLDFINELPLPERHPQNLFELKAGEKKCWEILLSPVESLNEVKKTITRMGAVPMIELERHGYSRGEQVHFSITSPRDPQIEIISPTGAWVKPENKGSLYTFAMEEIGEYTIRVQSGYTSEAKVNCRHEWSWYLKKARLGALTSPQKASTHLESWYGCYSAILAAKHFPQKELDNAAWENFLEILPCMYDMKKQIPLVMPQRICNHASMIGLLTDVYETRGDHRYLELAAGLADGLIESQGPDGAYRTQTGWSSGREDELGEHYTSVIYMAKSMMELILAEKNLTEGSQLWQERYNRHKDSVKRAVDDLCQRRDDVGTEGEHSFEDGMISCSALQIGFYALNFVHENERGKYIDAAVYLMNKHCCLEQQIIPDCRMNGCSLRFWEAQYDVLIEKNMINSPHGWTSWKTYATYYLYLLTGEIHYLKETMDTLNSCVQVIDNQSGVLRWAFIPDPFVKKYVWLKSGIGGSRMGKKQPVTFGESYVSMISSWYRKDPAVSYVEHEQFIYGGESLEGNGWSCDNDVHEHFKCLEEVALCSAFIYEDEAGDFQCWNGIMTKDKFDNIIIKVNESVVSRIHVNLKKEHSFIFHFKGMIIEENLNPGRQWVNKNQISSL